MKFYCAIIIVIYLLNVAVVSQTKLCNDNTCKCSYETEDGSVLYKADCSYRNLVEFPSNEEVSELNNLDLSHNEITTLDAYRNKIQSTNLKSLILSHNELSSVSDNFFEDITYLIELDLSHNRLSNFVNANLLNGLRNLKILNLSYNNLVTLPDDIFLPLPNLKDLDLSYNYLGALLMSFDNIFQSNLRLTSNVTSLKFDNIGITKLHHVYFDGTRTLKYLSMADNLFPQIPTVPYSVRHLDLSGSEVTSISASHLNYHSLKTLKLNRLRKLETIDRYAFYNLAALQVLSLEDCDRLKDFNSLAFGVIVKNVWLSLKKFSIARSGLRTLNATYLNLFNYVEHVDLQNNPWTCDCDLLWLQQLNGSLHKQDNIRCASPINLKSKAVMKLTDEDLPRCVTDGVNQRMNKILVPILGTLVIILGFLIAYLIYMGPIFYQNKYRGIGPGSPYRGATINIESHPADFFR